MTGYENTQYNDYASYNVLYIVLVLVVGGFIIAGSYIVPWAAEWLRKRHDDRLAPWFGPADVEADDAATMTDGLS